MKIIDLLNKIANGEYKDYITFEYNGTVYDIEDFGKRYIFTSYVLNKEVVIVGEVRWLN